MAHISTHKPTLGQRFFGILFLILAAGAHLESMYINGQYGYESGTGENYGAAALFIMADVAKFWLLPAISVGVWSLGMKTTLRGLWLLCLFTSIWAAANRYVDENASELFSSRTKSAALLTSQSDSESKRLERADINAKIAAIATTVDQKTAEQDVKRLEDAQDDARKAKEKQEEAAEKFHRNNGVACDNNGTCREALASRRRDYQAAQKAVAAAQNRLGEVRRRTELETRRDKLDAELLGLKAEVGAATKDTKKKDGIVQLAVNCFGVDEARAAFRIAVGKAILFIGLLEGLIFLAEPGSKRLWPHKELSEPENSPEVLAPLTEREAVMCPIVEPIASGQGKRGVKGEEMSGDELRTLRKKMGKTQPKMVEHLASLRKDGVSLSIYRKWEQGTSAVPSDVTEFFRSGKEAVIPKTAFRPTLVVKKG